MPKVLKAFPGDAPSMSDLIGQCMDGKVYEVDQAEIAGKPNSFVVSCYQKASKAGMKVRTRRIGRKVVLQFQKKS